MEPIEIAKSKLLSDSVTCFALLPKGEYQSEKRGIGPILEPLLANEMFFVGAVIASKVVGKATALLMAKGQVKMVYAKLISKPAADVFLLRHIPFSYSEMVPNIRDDSGDGIHPAEKMVLCIQNPDQAFKMLKKQWSEKSTCN